MSSKNRMRGQTSAIGPRGLCGGLSSATASAAIADVFDMQIVDGRRTAIDYGFSAIPKKWLADIKDWERLDAFIDQFLDLTL